MALSPLYFCKETGRRAFNLFPDLWLFFQIDHRWMTAKVFPSSMHFQGAITHQGKKQNVRFVWGRHRTRHYDVIRWNFSRGGTNFANSSYNKIVCSLVKKTFADGSKSKNLNLACASYCIHYVSKNWNILGGVGV